jgi:hypothetical protein
MKDSAKINLIGVYLLVFLLCLIAIPILVYRSSISDSFYRSLYYLGSAGGLGGTIYCIRGYYKALIDRPKHEFSLNYAWWYIFRPFESIVVGVLVYFLIVGGLLSVSTLSASPASLTKSTPFYCALAFIAGFSFTQFAKKLEELANTFFSVSGGDKARPDAGGAQTGAEAGGAQTGAEAGGAQTGAEAGLDRG